MNTFDSNKTIIKSISYDQDEILDWIMQLNSIKKFDLDPTYSKGNFYKGNIPQPKLKSDISPQFSDVKEADVTHLPLKDESTKSIIFDPPFLATSPKSKDSKDWKEGSNIMIGRFGYFKNVIALWDFYSRSLKELYRVLKEDGILVFKIQDTIESGKQYLSHVHVITEATLVGFYPKDLFILLSKNRLISGNWKKQVHARKFHSYFLVFIKK
jgi:tRNA G10  N-methylase Trm11